MAVIVTYLSTPEGAAALRHGIRMARERDEPLKVVDGSGGRAHVAGESGEPPFAEVGSLLSDSGLEWTVADPAPAGENLDDTASLAVEDPAADIIVVGIRQRSAVGKFLLGSSTQRLLLTVECPVVVVKAAPGD
ncbi:MAG: universal stress protein [Actinomycetaceae bacterium]